MTSDPRLRIPLLVMTGLVVHLTVLSRVRVAGVMPDFMILLAVAAGIVGGPSKGAVVGFACGFAVDLFLRTPLGLSALVYTMVGYGVGTAQSAILRTSWWIPMLTALVATAAGEVLFALSGSVVGETGMVNGRLLLVAGVVGGMNALLAPIVVRAMGWAMGRHPARGAFVI